MRTTAAYVLEVGDEVTIQVWGFDDLKKTAYIDNSGEITFPMVGPLKVAGQSLPKARELLTARLKKYIVDPQVEFTTTTGRQQVYVFGEVSNPGIVTYRRPLTVLEAITKVGWFTLAANRKNVALVRKAENKHYVYTVNTGELFQDGSKVPEIYLQAGDLVYVSPRGIIQFERFLAHLQTIAQTFLTIEQAVVLWPQFINAIEGKMPTTGLAISTSTGGTSSTTSSSSSGSSSK